MNCSAPECPICLLEEDNKRQLNDSNFICFICGIICCDYCSTNIDKCPMCRAPLRLTIDQRKDHFNDLLKREDYKYLYFAQYRIGASYMFLKNYDNALYWLESSAMLGFSLAQFTMGYIFLKGLSVDKNVQLSFEWFKLANENDCLEAKTVLAYFYLKGVHVDKDLEKAQKLFLDASNKGDALAQNNLANMYNNRGKMKEAFRWYKEASKQGCNRSKYMTAVYLEHGWGMWKPYKNKAFRIYKDLCVELVKIPLTIKDRKLDAVRQIIISDNVLYF